jgi:hypothetical protein
MQPETTQSINLLKDFRDLSETLNSDTSGDEVRKICSYFEVLATRTSADKLRSDDMEFKRIADLQYEALCAARRIVTEVWEHAQGAKLV